jgi:hypothetical protein
MSPNARGLIEPLYKKLVEAEQSGGMEASKTVLTEFLSENGASIATFNDAMEKLQNS